MDNNQLQEIYNWIEKNLLPEGSKLRGIQKISLCKYMRYSGNNPNFLTVMPTGAGKSVLFQGPALYNSLKQDNRKKTLNIVISPLKALMDDQVDKLLKFNKNGLKRVACIHGGTADEDIQDTLNSIKNHNLVLLYVAPERILTKSFYNILIKQASDGFISSITFDEAHCVISWGNSFRPDYVTALRKCINLRQIGRNFPIHLLSATVPSRTRLQLIDELEIEQQNITPNCVGCNEECILCQSETQEDYGLSYNQLQEKALERTLYPINNNIKLSCREVKGLSDNQYSEYYQKLIVVYNRITEKPIFSNLTLTPPASRVIIFTTKKEDAKKGSDWLNNEFKDNNIPLVDKVDYFHADREDEDKARIKEEYLAGKKVILFATTAFGLGMDIPNIHLVINLSPPLFLEDYLQEVGRAGRDPYYYIEGQQIEAICLYSQNHDLHEPKGNDTEETDEITPTKVSIAFKRISDYYFSILGDSNEQPMIPIPAAIIVASEKDKSLYAKKTREAIEPQFRQILNWLSNKKGLNRIELGFPCRNVFEISFNENKDIDKYSDKIKNQENFNKVKYLYEYAGSLLTKRKGFGKHLFLEASNVIADKESGIEDIYDFRKILNICCRYNLFGREFQMLYINLKNKDALTKFQESNSLQEFDKIIAILDGCSSEEDTNNEFFGSLSKSANTDAQQVMLFCYYLSKIFCPDTIKILCYSLYSFIANQITTDDNNWFKWDSIVQLLRKKKSWEPLKIHEIDDDDARLILLTLSSLGYITIDNSYNDYYELKIVNKTPILWTSDSDRTACRQITEMAQGKKDSSNKMKEIVKKNCLNEESIKEYSKGQSTESQE